jgi:cytochrome P450
MDLVADFAVPLPLMVIAELLGVPATEWRTFRRWSDSVLGLISAIGAGASAAAAREAFRQVHGEMRAYLAPLLARRREAATDDLLSRLVHAEVNGERLSDEEILGFFELLLVAGHETTTNLIGSAVLCLLEHPDQLARLRAEPERWPGAIEEVLRYRSPVQAVFRVTRRDVALRGRTIPAGKLVLVMIGSANRDAARFERPARFDAMRSPNAHVAFGHGIHFCIGASLARLEARVALPALFDRLPGLAIAQRTPWTPRPALHVHGPARLLVRFDVSAPAT